MPTTNSSLTSPDVLIMNPNEVNKTINNFLEQKGFLIAAGSSHFEVDIRAVKKDVEFFIESRGNQAYKNSGTDLVFDGSQLDIQLSEQLSQVMRFQQSISPKHTPIFIMAFPDINRIKERVAKISKGLDKLEILRLWVNDFKDLKVEGPESLIKIWESLIN
jgi:hypothetical protein